jgi:hypothetical protein
MTHITFTGDSVLGYREGSTEPVVLGTYARRKLLFEGGLPVDAIDVAAVGAVIPLPAELPIE